MCLHYLLQFKPMNSMLVPVSHSHLASLYDRQHEGTDKTQCCSPVVMTTRAVRALDGCVSLLFILTICLILKRKSMLIFFHAKNPIWRLVHFLSLHDIL